MRARVWRTFSDEAALERGSANLNIFGEAPEAQESEYSAENYVRVKAKIDDVDAFDARGRTPAWMATQCGCGSVDPHDTLPVACLSLSECIACA